MQSLKRHEGYLLIDHRFSPGIPDDLARKAGYDPGFTGEGKMFEAATNTCAHCHGIVVLNPDRTRGRAYCSKCDKYICDACNVISLQPTYVHMPMVKLSDAILEMGIRGIPVDTPLALITSP